MKRKINRDYHTLKSKEKCKSMKNTFTFKERLLLRLPNVKMYRDI